MIALSVELAKMRRLKVWLVAAGIAAGTLLLASMRLFSAAHRAAINDPATQHWEGMLLFYAMVKAMTAPILVAVLASRQVDIEHQGNGWAMAATLGQPRGRLCATKIAALAPVVAGVTVVELGGLYAGSKLAGAALPVPAGPWWWYAAASFAVTMALLALHVLLAARVENQLAGLGIGVLGAFAGVFVMLMPDWLARMLPWGYYAVVATHRMTPDGYAATPIAWPALALFLLVVAALVTAGLHLLDRTES
ncbi:MAG: ABC transporter permease [Propionibacteriaceae bacterium]|nr:ABC transporter permease [Propionibacteriaceae bacterium]